MIRTFTMLQFMETGRWPEEPFVLKFRSFDIPETVDGMIRNLPANCIAMGLSDHGGALMRRRAERAARKRGMRILWRGYMKQLREKYDV